MEYQEIITVYKNNSLVNSDFINKIDKAKLLKGRPRYRAIDIVDNSLTLNSELTYLLTMPENSEKAEKFLDNLDVVLYNYFFSLINSIKYCKAWNIIGSIPNEWSNEEFDGLSRENKFKELYNINQKYYDFLEYQTIADIRDLFEWEELTATEIKKLDFLIKMFNNFKNERIKSEFFCFDKKFLMALMNFKKSRQLRIEEYMESKRPSIQEDYKKYSVYFLAKDFRDIMENLELTSKNLKISLTKTIEAFCELSETNVEKSHLQNDFEALKNLEKKYKKMDGLKKSMSDLKKVKKERVFPIIFTWFERENLTFVGRVTNKKIIEFFEQIKKLQSAMSVRMSLFLVTNTDKEVTLKRLQELQKKASENGLPKLIEGAYGGYSTFRIDNDGTITDISRMSEVNRAKIIKLLEKGEKQTLSKKIIVEEEKNYLRYQVADKKSKMITKEYLEQYIGQILQDEKIKRQPLKFLPYIEKNCSGIDIVLESQLKGIEQLSEYYKSKYNVSGNVLEVDIASINDFIKEVKESV